MTKPFISCLCPTWRRPKLLANAIACFEAQDYPADRCELIVLDDAGQIKPYRSPVWEKSDVGYTNTAVGESDVPGGVTIISVSRRFNSLSEKYNALAGMARGGVLAVWEDDDIYLPHHLSLIAEHIEGRAWSKPDCVRSLYTGHDEIEAADGRFHASIALQRQAFIWCQGWPLTTALNFDQQMFKRLATLGKGVYKTDDPSYVFRWGSTNSYHGQGFGDDWWDKAASQGDMTEGPITIMPKFDEETERIYDSRRKAVGG